MFDQHCDNVWAPSQFIPGEKDGCTCCVKRELYTAWEYETDTQNGKQAPVLEHFDVMMFTPLANLFIKTIDVSSISLSADPGSSFPGLLYWFCSPCDINQSWSRNGTFTFQCIFDFSFCWSCLSHTWCSHDIHALWPKVCGQCKNIFV